MNDILKIIGSELRILRVREGLNQKELAEKINIKPQVLSNYENGKSNFSIKTLNKIINFYGINIYIFFKQISEYTHTNKEE